MTEDKQKHKSARWNRRAFPMRECFLDAKGKRAILKAHHVIASLAAEKFSTEIEHDVPYSMSLFEVNLLPHPPPPHHTQKIADPAYLH